MDFQTEYKKRTDEIEKVITAYLPKEEGYQKTVMEAMNYSFLAGGKRLRPMLMWETYRLFGGLWGGHGYFGRGCPADLCL